MVSISSPRLAAGQIRAISAQVASGVWSCEDGKFLSVLQALQLPQDYHPDRDLELAQLAIRYYGGIVQDDRPNPSGVPTDAADGGPESSGLKKADWDEALHPRDERGRFGEGSAISS